jgi:apolipoprotein N-acyltransferase
MRKSSISPDTIVWFIQNIQYIDVSKSLKKKYLWLFIAGLFSSLVFEPFSWGLMLLAPTLWLLLSVLRGSLGSSAFYAGWFFGFGHFLGGLYWISISLTLDFSKFFWLLPFSLCCIPAILACLVGFATFLSRKIAYIPESRSQWPMALMFCVLWCAFEWLRGHILSGFPWNLIGYGFVSSIEASQIASSVGVYGLSVIFMVSAVLAFHRIGVWVTGFIWVCLWGYGYMHLRAPSEFVDGVYLRLVQPSIEQKIKWKREYKNIVMQKMIDLSLQRSSRPLTHIIWPESATVFDVYADERATSFLADILPGNTKLIFGAPRIEREHKDGTNYGPVKAIYNSLFALDKYQGLEHLYDKHTLVPFGEYIPWKQYVPFVKKLTAGDVDYSPGDGLRSIKIGERAPYCSPLICYEIIFPNHVADFASGEEGIGPKWILNITNDAWFGNSTGPYQHLSMAIMRAIETGLPVIRVANNGVSAVIDGKGRLLQKLPLNEVGVIDSALPKAYPMTLYNRYGDLFFFLILGFIAIISLSGIFYYKRFSYESTSASIYQ